MGRSPLDAARARGRRRLLVITSALFVVPLAIALAVLHDPRWYPSLELAQTELHVRDVGTTHTPLTGLIGRLGAAGERGSHPGPLGFYALAPVYRLAGSTPWALQVATVMLHLAAVGTALWIGRRRGGMRVAALAAAVLAGLLRFYGASVLTEPWNPYLPMLWWVVFVLAVWSVLEDDLPLLPLAVISGSLCAQTHVSYVGLVGGLGGCAVAITLIRAARRRRHVTPARRTSAWLASSAAIGAVLWVPPVLDELKGGTGNLSVLVDHFTDSSTDTIGLRRGIDLVLVNLDPWRLLLGHAEAKVVTDPASWPVGSLLLVAAWIASIVVAWRFSQWSILRLDAVLGIALGFGALAASRINGITWAWLTLWARGLTALLVLAIAWTATCLAQRLVGGSARIRLFRLGALTALAVVALFSIGLASDAVHVEPNDLASSNALRRLVPATLTALDGDASDDRYLITWTDPIGVTGDLQAFGLANELDRAGIEVGFGPANRLRAAPYLTIDASQATAVLRVVTGPAITDWDGTPGVRRVALYDPRTGDQRALQKRLRSEIDDALRELGHADLIPQLESSFVGSMIQLEADPRMPRSLIAKMRRALELGTPSAVFIEEERA